MYKPEECKTALVGFLLGQLDMAAPTKTDPNKRFYPFVVKLTQPCEAFNREKQKVTVPIGEEVLVASAKLQSEFGNAANNPKSVVEIFIQPKKKINLDGGKTMWTYTMGAGRIVPREGDLRLFGGQKAVPTLAMGQGGEDAEIPF